MAAVLCKFTTEGVKLKIRMDWTAGEEMELSLSSILFTVLLVALNNLSRCHNIRNLSTQQNAASKRRATYLSKMVKQPVTKQQLPF